MQNLNLKATQEGEKIKLVITFDHSCEVELSQHRLREDGYANVLENVCQQIKYDLSESMKKKFYDSLIALETSNTR